jgi:hypothetical protein
MRQLVSDMCGKGRAAAQCWDDIVQRLRDKTENSKTVT